MMPPCLRHYARRIRHAAIRLRRFAAADKMLMVCHIMLSATLREPPLIFVYVAMMPRRDATPLFVCALRRFDVAIAALITRCLITAAPPSSPATAAMSYCRRCFTHHVSSSRRLFRFRCRRCRLIITPLFVTLYFRLMPHTPHFDYATFSACSLRHLRRAALRRHVLRHTRVTMH